MDPTAAYAFRVLGTPVGRVTQSPTPHLPANLQAIPCAYIPHNTRPYLTAPPTCHATSGHETPPGPRKVAQGQRHTQAETKPTSLTLHISLLEARDLALGRGSPPVCTEAHRTGSGRQTLQSAQRTGSRFPVNASRWMYIRGLSKCINSAHLMPLRQEVPLAPRHPHSSCQTLQGAESWSRAQDSE